MRRVKLGTYIEQSEMRNSDNALAECSVVGLSTQKELITTKADLDGVSMNSYKLLPPKHFGYVADTSRRGEKMSLGYNTTDKTFLVSSSYIVFKVKEDAELLPDFLFMYFNRPEFDRYARFNSWGSARETFSWTDMCDMEIDLPSVPEQEKLVAVYNAIKQNQEVYENGLDDLKLTCDAFIENLRREMPSRAIGKYIGPVTERNSDKKVTKIMGVEASSQFMTTKANMGGVDIGNYKVVSKDDFAYNPSRINLGSIALFTEDQCAVSPMYEVFRIIDKNELLPQYLKMWLTRDEFHRYTWFHASGSVRDTFDFNLMKEVQIPIPSIEIQQSIVNMYTAYVVRRELNVEIKKLLKEVCPILIRRAHG